MRIMQIITDYVAKSILTTKGDMVVRGDSVPEKLAAPAASWWLVGNGLGAKPIWTAALGGAGTEGDLIVRASAICQRIAAVAVGKVLKSAGTTTIPVWGAPFIAGADVATGSYTYGATGDEIVSGLGFKPGLVGFFARDDTVPGLGWSVGFDNGTEVIEAGANNDTGVVTVRLTSSISIQRTAGNVINGSISAIGGDGFTVSHNLAGTCVALICWFAIG